MDRASDYGSEGWGFESLRARSGPPRCDPPVGVLHFYQALLRECFFHAHPLVVVPASRFPVRSEMTSAQQRAYLSGGATELTQHAPFRSCSAKNFAQRSPSCGVFAKKFAQHAIKRSFWAIFRALGELFRAHAHTWPSRANFFAHRAQPRGDDATSGTSAATGTGQHETTITTAAEIRAKNNRFSPAKATPVSVRQCVALDAEPVHRLAQQCISK